MANRSDTSPSSSEENKKLMPRSRAAIDLRTLSHDDLNTLISPTRPHNTDGSASTPSKKSSIRRASSAAERHKDVKTSIKVRRSQDTNDIRNDPSASSSTPTTSEDYRSTFNSSRQLFLQLEASESPEIATKAKAQFRPINLNSRIQQQNNSQPYHIQSPRKSGRLSVPTSTRSSPTNEYIEPMTASTLTASADNLSSTIPFDEKPSSLKRPILKKQLGMENNIPNSDSQSIDYPLPVNKSKPQNHKATLKIIPRKINNTNQSRPFRQNFDHNVENPVAQTQQVPTSFEYKPASPTEPTSRLTKFKPIEFEDTHRKTNQSQQTVASNSSVDDDDGNRYRESSLPRRRNKINTKNTSKKLSNPDIGASDDCNQQLNDKKSHMKLPLLSNNLSKPPKPRRTPPSQRRLHEFKKSSGNRSNSDIPHVKSPTDSKINQPVTTRPNDQTTTAPQDDDTNLLTRTEPENNLVPANRSEDEVVLDKKFGKSMEMMNIAKAANIEQFRSTNDSDSDVFDEGTNRERLSQQDRQSEGQARIQPNIKSSLGSLQRKKNNQNDTNEQVANSQPAVLVTPNTARNSIEDRGVEIHSDDEIDMFEYQFSLNQPSVFSDTENYDIQSTDRRRVNSSSEAIGRSL